MSILFANNRQTGGTSGHLVEFKAGRTLLEPGSAPDKRKAVAEKAKGLIYIKQSSDQLMHFCWKNREKNTTDLDLIIFPGECEFIKIKECTEGRVYMLKFKSGDDHKLFWLQEAKTDKDDDYCKKVNDLLNNPPTLSSRARAGGSEQRSGSANALAALNSAIASNDDIGALGNMDQQQIMQLFSLMNSGNADIMLPQLGLNTNAESPTSTETPKARKERSEASGGNQANKFDTATLNQIFSSLPGTSSSKKVELSKVFTRANVEDVVKKNEKTLSPHLPQTGEEKEINQTIGSPQFQQAVDSFGAALYSGQLGGALSHFNVDQGVIDAANKADLLEFADAFTKSQKKSGKEVDKQINEEAAKEESTEQAAKKKDDDEEGMDLD